MSELVVNRIKRGIADLVEREIRERGPISSADLAAALLDALVVLATDADVDDGVLHRSLQAAVDSARTKARRS